MQSNSDQQDQPFKKKISGQEIYYAPKSEYFNAGELIFVIQHPPISDRSSERSSAYSTSYPADPSITVETLSEGIKESVSKLTIQSDFFNTLILKGNERSAKDLEKAEGRISDLRLKLAGLEKELLDECGNGNSEGIIKKAEAVHTTETELDSMFQRIKFLEQKASRIESSKITLDRFFKKSSEINREVSNLFELNKAGEFAKGYFLDQVSNGENSILSILVVRIEERQAELNSGMNLFLWALNAQISALTPSMNSGEQENIRILSVSPNWNVAADMGNIISGGPGAVPIPIQMADAPLNSVPKMAGSSQLDVYILDTIPPPAQVNWALKSFPRNELLKSFLGNIDWQNDMGNLADHSRLFGNGTGDQFLTLDYYLYDSSRGDEEFFLPTLKTLKNYPYDFVDHGTFIGGLIYDYLRNHNVNIHLIEVMNNHGVGSIKSVLSGLQKLIRKIEQAKAADPDRRALINLSFHIILPSSQTSPVSADSFIDLISELLKELTIRDFQELFGLELIDNLLSIIGHHPLGENGLNEDDESSRSSVNLLVSILLSFSFFLSISELLRDTNTLILSAVGNDSIGFVPPKLPRYPAALETVVGVAAADDSDEREEYSNRPNQALGYVFAKGGGINHKETSREKGLSGIFTVPYFPYESRNVSGYGVWSGTSFATGVATAKVAERILSTNESPREALMSLQTAGSNIKVSEVGEPDVDVSKIE